MQRVLSSSVSANLSALCVILSAPPLNVSFLKPLSESSLYLIFDAPYTPNEALVKRPTKSFRLELVCGLILFCVVGVSPAHSQEAASHAAQQATKTPEASEKQPELPAQIELLE